MRKFETLNLEYIAQNIELARLSGLFNPLLTALIALTFLLVLWVGGYGCCRITSRWAAS